VPEGVVGLFTPAASPVEEEPPEAAVAAAVFLLAAALDEEGVLPPPAPLPSTPLLPVLDDEEEAAVCLGEISDAFDVLEVTRLAFLTGVVGFELRPPCGVLLPDDPGDVPVGVW
jgi:hypothetical protein